MWLVWNLLAVNVYCSPHTSKADAKVNIWNQMHWYHQLLLKQMNTCSISSRCMYIMHVCRIRACCSIMHQCWYDMINDASSSSPGSICSKTIGTWLRISDIRCGASGVPWVVDAHTSNHMVPSIAALCIIRWSSISCATYSWCIINGYIKHHPIISAYGTIMHQV